MSKQDNDFSRRRMLGMTVGAVLRRRVVAGIAAVIMGASLVFTGSTSAHNIDLDKAWELARNYARSVRKESGRYLHYSTNCVRAFPKHNHIVRCVIQYQDAKDTAAGMDTCIETIELFLPPHRDR